MKKTVLVTGGAGFIGSHLSESLIQRGYNVRIMDNLSYGRREWVPDRAEFILGDICNINDCLLATKNVEGIFHMAAMSRAGPSLDNIDICTQANVIGTQNILISARDNGVKKLIYSGSSTYYGSQPPPHKENFTKADFLNFYSLSKHVGAEYCLLFNKVFNLPTVVLRYFNVYGPRQPQEGAYALVLGIFLKRWSEGKQLIIHGDGSQRRDFIYVSDVVDANIAALESDVSGEIFNVGSGENVSIKELANLITPLQVHEERRKGDAEITLADISDIQNRLKWAPKISFNQGLNEMMERVKAGKEI